MSEAETEKPRHTVQGCGCLLALAGIVVLVVWGGVTLVRDFMRHDPAPAYDVGKTLAVTAPPARCYSVTVPELPASKEKDGKAQLEHDALQRTVDMTCDLNVKVTCYDGYCTATYGGKTLRYDVTYIGACTPMVTVEFCKYKMQAENRFLSQRRVNEAFWEATKQERKHRAAVRCDIIPGGADLLPPDSDDASTAATKYRCYTRRPKSVTYSYKVLMAGDTTILFDDGHGNGPD